MRHHVSHIRRDIELAVAGFVLIVMAAWILEGAGFALAVSMVVGTAMALTIPFVSIWFDQRDLPRDGYPKA